MGLTTHLHAELRLSISTAVLLNNICVSHGLLWADIYISRIVHLITLLMQHSLTVIPVNTNLPLTKNCTQCTVSADIGSAYTIQLLSVRNTINQNILYTH